jgi:hypothetical protein
MGRSVLMTWLDFIVLAHWNNCPRIYMSTNSDTLSWFRANQPLLFLLSGAYLAKKQQMPILSSLVWLYRGSNPRSTTLEPRIEGMILSECNCNTQLYWSACIMVGKWAAIHICVWGIYLPILRLEFGTGPIQCGILCFSFYHWNIGKDNFISFHLFLRMRLCEKSDMINKIKTNKGL